MVPSRAEEVLAKRERLRVVIKRYRQAEVLLQPARERKLVPPAGYVERRDRALVHPHRPARANAHRLGSCLRAADRFPHRLAERRIHHLAIRLPWGGTASARQNSASLIHYPGGQLRAPYVEREYGAWHALRGELKRGEEEDLKQPVQPRRAAREQAESTHARNDRRPRPVEHMPVPTAGYPACRCITAGHQARYVHYLRGQVLSSFPNHPVD